MSNHNSKPGLEGIKHFLQRINAKLDQVINGIEFPELNWRHFRISNTIGNLIKHITGSESFWIHHVVGGYKTNRDRPSEFEKNEFQIINLREEIDNVHEITNNVLTNLTNEQLTEMYPMPPQWAAADQNTTIHWCLMHVLEHTAQHIGQIFYIRKLYAER